MSIHAHVLASDASALRLHLLRHPTHLHLLDDGGESALHVAARRSDLPMVRELLVCGFDVNTRSSSGWTPLEVAQASAGREVVRAVYVAVQADERARWRRRRGGFLAALRAMPDFRLELKWKLGLHVLGVGVGALLSRFLPSDEYTLWKRGARLRADAGLIGLDAKALSWRRGVVSFLSRFDHAPQTPELVMVNHQTRRAAPYLRTWAFLEPSAGLPPDEGERLLESGLARHTPAQVGFASERVDGGGGGGREVAPELTAFGRHAVDPQSVCGLPCRRHAVTYAITLYERMLGPGAAGSTAVDVLNGEPAAPPGAPAGASAPPPPGADEGGLDEIASLGRQVGLLGKPREVRVRLSLVEGLPLTVPQMADVLSLLAPINPHVARAREFLLERLPAGTFPLYVHVPLVLGFFVEARLTAYEGFDAACAARAVDAAAVFEPPPGFDAVDEGAFLDEFFEGFVEQGEDGMSAPPGGRARAQTM